MTKKRTSGASLPPLSTWADVLVAELSRRFAALVADMGVQAADPVLKGIVITDTEIGGILSNPASNAQTLFVAGSLMRQLAEEAPKSSAHLSALQQRCHLSGFEMDCLLVCLAGEIVPKFERVFAYLNDSMAAKLPGADILLRTVAPGQLSLLSLLGRDARLLRYGLLSSVDGARLGPYRVAEGVVRYALQQGGFDPVLSQAWCNSDVPPLAPALWNTRASEIENLERLLRSQFTTAAADQGPLVVGLHARDGSGRQFLVESACNRVGIGCISLDARKLKNAETMQRTLTAAMRDSLLLGAAVFVHHIDSWLEDAQALADVRAHLQPLVRELGWIVILASQSEPALAAWFPAARVVELAWPPLNVAARDAAWRVALKHLPACPQQLHAGLAATLGVKFRLTQGEIALAIQRVVNTGSWPATETGWSELLHRVAGSVATPHLARLAQAITVRHSLDDLVLPADRMGALHDIVRRVRHRSKVLEQWGLDSVSTGGRGLVALFHGPSGTGKTMAAESIAGALRMQLFRIDLAGVVSKYIGETEKNLRVIFEEADRADAVLFFDEADALFGKRSDVKDAHDRYANIEINYLLQRIEQFEGIAILATNMRAHLDEAFLRRIHITVDFPLPRETERLGLWDRSFPTSAPLDDHIDWAFLAQRFELTGGAIRNAALGAAFLAADAEGLIGMPEIINALRTELVKAGKRVSDQDFGQHARYLSVPRSTTRSTRRPVAGAMTPGPAQFAPERAELTRAASATHIQQGDPIWPSD
jgi:hypothetical protein